MNKVVVVIFMVVFLAMLGVASAKSCYECKYTKSKGQKENNPACRDSPYQVVIRQCPGGCHKFVGEVDENEILIRKCAEATQTTNSCDKDTMIDEGKTYSGNVCICNGDSLCNSAVKTSAAAIVFPIIGAVFYMLL